MPTVSRRRTYPSGQLDDVRAAQARECQVMSPGMPKTARSHSMHRLSSLTMAALLTVLLASPAKANDSLLSGYGGPGNGEQAVLGSQLVGGSSGGGKNGGGGGSGATAPLR